MEDEKRESNVIESKVGEEIISKMIEGKEENEEWEVKIKIKSI